MTVSEITATTAPAADGPPRAVGERPRSLPRWPLILIALPAAVAVWSGWVGLGTLCGFGIVHPLPGIWDSFKLNTAITLPVGVEAYGAYALAAWLHPGTSATVKRFARNSALGSLGLGMGGQVIYHLLTAWHVTVAPWPVVTLVSCLPVLTLGFGTALTHLLRTGHAPAPDADGEPDSTPDTRPDIGPDTPAVSDADSAPAIEAATTTDAETDTHADSGAASKRTAARTRRGPSTATRVARMRDKHPDESPADIATRLKLSDRTVRRYWPGEPEANAA
jgi:hypothetical protein